MVFQMTTSVIVLLAFLMITQCKGMLTVSKNIDPVPTDNDENSALDETDSVSVEVESDGSTIDRDPTIIELESLIEEELRKELKQCPYPEDTPFVGTQKDFLDLLLHIEMVQTAELVGETDVFWKYYLQSEGVKEWNSYLTVVAANDQSFWCVLQCDFTPEEQLGEGRKYLFVNNWNREELFRPNLFVGEGGVISLERTFAILKRWNWGFVYDVFSVELIRYLISIDTMQSQLRIEEDAAKI